MSGEPSKPTNLANVSIMIGDLASKVTRSASTPAAIPRPSVRLVPATAKNSIDRQVVLHQASIERKTTLRPEMEQHSFRPSILSRSSSLASSSSSSERPKISLNENSSKSLKNNAVRDIKFEPEIKFGPGSELAMNATASAAEQGGQSLNIFKPLDGRELGEIAGVDGGPEEKNLKIDKNDLGLLEISRDPTVVDSDVDEAEMIGQEAEAESASESDESSSIDLTCHETPLESPWKDGSGQGSSPELASSKASPKLRDDDIICCEGCGCYGMAGDFLNPRACGEACHRRILQRNKDKEKKERELLVQKARREARKREQLKAKGREQLEQARKIAESGGFAQVVPVKVEPKEEPEDEGEPEDVESGDQIFSWGRYLDATNAKGVPAKFFLRQFPNTLNHFKVGMKLETVDPEHQSLFCVVTVAEVKGFRIRLHIDGWSPSYDFWVDADSPDIFPPGWCESHRQKLEPPKDHQWPFSWKKYVAMCGGNSSLAPSGVFPDRPKVHPSDTTGWSVGGKLEAVDKHNISMICVATVGNVFNGRILIHFDGWEMDYDYWIKPDSPYVHPRGYCEKKGLNLNKPKGYRGDFNWERYLLETGSKPIPHYAFKNRRNENTLFKRGFKLEAVDVRNPALIRVATVADTELNQIKVHYDGWPSDYDFWCDDESPLIHPTSWCLKTGHPLEPPLTNREIKRTKDNSCPTPGCTGFGHVKGSLHPSHDNLTDCPYSPRNLRSVESPIIPDRLSMPQNEGGVGLSDERGIKNRKRPRFSDENDSGHAAKMSPARPIRVEAEAAVRDSVFRPVQGYRGSDHESLVPLNWHKNTDFLKRTVTQNLREVDVREWGTSQVANFVNNLLGSSGVEGVKMIEEEIDGEAFMMLTQADLTKILGFKLGPAIKIFNAILLIRSAN